MGGGGNDLHYDTNCLYFDFHFATMLGSNWWGGWTRYKGIKGTSRTTWIPRSKRNTWTSSEYKVQHHNRPPHSKFLLWNEILWPCNKSMTLSLLYDSHLLFVWFPVSHTCSHSSLCLIPIPGSRWSTWSARTARRRWCIGSQWRSRSTRTWGTSRESMNVYKKLTWIVYQAESLCWPFPWVAVGK